MVRELRLGDISVDVVLKDIKNVHLSVHPPTGRVRIAAPRSMTLETIRLFAISRLGWIKRQQRKQQAQERETPREYIERESHYLWGRRYLLRIVEDVPRSYVAIDHRHIELGVPEGADTEKRQAVLDSWTPAITGSDGRAFEACGAVSALAGPDRCDPGAIWALSGGLIPWRCGARGRSGGRSCRRGWRASV